MKNKKKSKVTLKDIAEDAGISISTVSRALARTGLISAENEKKIFESAQRLNYPIKHLNTPLELRSNIFIALVTRYYAGEFYASLYDGFDKATKGTNAQVALINVSNASVDEIGLINELQRNRFDAAVVFLPDFDQKDYAKLIEKTDPNFPIISVAPINGPVMDTVTFDNYRGGHLVASHFYDRGFKKLGIILGPQNKSEAMLRKNGFIDFIQGNDEMELVWQFDGNYDLTAGFNAYTSFKNAKVKPDAIFCSNDAMTIGFMHKALRDGVKIPEDIALASYDNLPICQLHTPSITSVNTPYQMLGKKAIEYLLNRLKNNSTSDHAGYTSLIPVSLDVRESSTTSTLKTKKTELA